MEIIFSILWEICAYTFVEAGLQVFFYGIGRLCLGPIALNETKDDQKHDEHVYILVGILAFISFIFALHKIKAFFL